MRHAPDEPALLQRVDQTVDAGLGLEAQGVLHLVEGGRDPGLADALIDEIEELELLLRQHETLRKSGRNKCATTSAVFYLVRAEVKLK